MTTYLLEIMIFGAVLFIFVSVWEKRRVERPDSGGRPFYSASLDAVDLDLLVRLAKTAIRTKCDFGADAK